MRTSFDAVMVVSTPSTFFIVFIFMMLKSLPSFPTLFCIKNPFDLVSKDATNQAKNITQPKSTIPIKDSTKSNTALSIKSLTYIL